MPSLPPTMRAVAISSPGGPEVLKLAELPMPRPGPGQVLVKVAAAGVNRPDVAQRQGVYPPPPGHSALPGLEIAGEVVEAGAGVARWKGGDQVCALVNGGGYAEYCIAEETAALPIPAGLDLVRAAALPETFFTVWNNVFERGRLAAGEWLMVHGGSSGIGTTAIQLAKARGAHVIATAGSADKCRACLDLGADRAVDYKREDFVAAAREATGGKGVNVILDMVGGEYTDKNIVAAAEDGRIVQIATLGGVEAKVNLAPHHDEAPHADGLDLAAALARGEGGVRARAGGRGVAAAGGRQGEGGDGLHLPPRARRRRPPPAGDEPAHRQDRADGVGP